MYLLILIQNYVIILMCVQMQGVMASYRVTDDGIKSAMKECYEADGYLLCPHTAIAVRYHLDKLKQ